MTDHRVPSIRIETNEQGVVMLAAEDAVAYLRYCGLNIWRELAATDPMTTYIACSLLETVADRFADHWIDFSREEAGL